MKHIVRRFTEKTMFEIKSNFKKSMGNLLSLSYSFITFFRSVALAEWYQISLGIIDITKFIF